MTGSHTLYTRQGSGGFVVEVALALAGIPVDTIEVPRDRADPRNIAFRRDVNPLGQVPVLILPDGGRMTESCAICLHLTEAYPEAGLGPVAGMPHRRDFLRWMTFMSSALYPALLKSYYPHRHTTDPNGSEAVKAAATADADRLFAFLEDEMAGRQWLVGETFSIADIYLAMLAHWHPVAERPRQEWTNIVSLCRRVAEHPGAAEANKTHRLW